MNIFKERFINARVFILIVITAIIIASGILYMANKRQDKKDAEFEKSREGIQQMIKSTKNLNNN